MIQILSGQLFTMFLMLLVGFVVFRTHLTNHEGNKTLANILLLVANSAMLLDSLLSIEYKETILHGLLISILLGFLCHFAVILVSYPFLGKADRHPQIGIERYMTVFSNCGFMGIPLVYATFGPEAVLYLTGYLIPNNILTWSYGVPEITGRMSWRQVGKGLCSPNIICILIGLVCLLCRIPVELHVRRAVSYIGSMTTPMGMIVAGTALAETGLRGVLKRPRLFLVTALKLAAAPMATCLILILTRRVIPFGEDIFYGILIPSACPAATTGTMLALRYDKDYQYASQIFIVSTLLSLVSIPAMVSLIRMIAF